jgi:Domain of unknown function (DUF4124)
MLLILNAAAAITKQSHPRHGATHVNQCRKPAPFLIATAVEFARAGTFAAVLSTLCTNVTGAPNNVQPIAAPSAPTIYKLVDANGRVTYSNSPTKGAAKVELDPITVIPSTPAGMLGGGQANVSSSNASQATASPELIPVGIAPSIAKPEAPTMPLMPIASPSVQPTFTASARTPIVQPATATVTPVSASIANRTQTPVALVADNETTPAYKLPVVKLSPRDPAPSDATTAQTSMTAPTMAMVAPPQPVAIATANANSAPITTTTATTAREAEARPQVTIASPKFSQEEQLLAQLKARLVEEQNASASFRAMRARLPTTIDQSDPAKAASQNDIKAQVEQHFERIRSLQDQIAQREQALAVLRQ